LNDRPTSYWPLDDKAASSVISDLADSNDGVVEGGVVLGVTGGASDGETAAEFDGSTGYVSTTKFYDNPGTGGYSVEAAFKTVTTVGGKLAGFESLQIGDSVNYNYDRMIYMTDAGTLIFGHWNFVASPFRPLCRIPTGLQRRQMASG
jgi:hypothetical protein